MFPRIRAAILKIPRSKVSSYGAIARGWLSRIGASGGVGAGLDELGSGAKAKKMKKTLVAGVFMAAALCAAGQTAPAAENPAEKLIAVLGRWEVEGTPTGRYAKQGKTRTLRECRWAPQGHDYLICSLVVTSATMGDRRQLTIYSYNPKENNYVVVAIVNPGMQPLPPVTLNIQGNMWTTVTENTFAGKSTQIRSTTERLAPDRATMKIESSDDGGAHWTLMATGTEKKIAD